MNSRLWENKFKAIFDKTFNYTALVSCEGTIIEVNKTALDFAGMEINAVKGIKIWEANWWADKKFNQIKLKDSLLKACSGDFVRYETEIISHLGKSAVIDFSIKPVFSDDGKVDVLIAEGRDITEIKKYQDELNASRNQLEIFVKHTPAAVAMFDRKMNYLAASERWYKDYEVESSYIIGKSHYEVFPEISRKKDWLEIHESCLQGNIEKSERDFFVRKSGAVDWVKWEIHPWFDSFGSIGGIIMFTEIISKQVEAEAEIKKQKKKSEKYLELAGSIIAAFDKDGKIVRINKKWCDITGYDYSEVAGVDWIENFIPEQDKESVRNIFSNIIKGNLKPFESAEGEILTKNGDTRIISWSNSVVYDESGNFEVILSSGEDITEKKIAEKKIFEQSQLLEQVMESVVSADSQGLINYWNKGSKNLFGYLSSEVIGKHISIFFPPGKKDFFTKKIINELKTKDSFLVESELQKKSGEIFSAYVSVSSKKDKNGKKTGIICSSIDITERKQYENEVLKLNENLEQRVTERTKLLEDANKAVTEGIKRARLIKETASAANLNKNPFNAFERVLKLVCDYSGFDIGHIYLKDENNKNLLIPSTVWYSKNLKYFRNFVDVTMETRFEKGTGLPGIVMETCRPFWVEDIFEEKRFIRTNFLKEHNLVSALGFPVLLNSQTEVVFEFYSRDFKKRDFKLEETLMEAGAQLGYALERFWIDFELKESESKLRAIFDHSSQLIGLLDSNGKILNANNTLVKMTGVNLEDFIGKYIWEGKEWFEKDFSLNLKSYVEKASKGQKINVETVLNDYQGSKRNIDFSLIPVKNEKGKITNLIPEGIDITLRRQAEEQLKKLALAVEKTINGVIISDKEGYIEWVNDGFTRITGYTLEECKGKKPGSFLQGEETDLKTVEKIRDALNQKKGIKTELLNYKKNGEKFWIEIDIQPVFDEQNQLTNFISIENNITDRYIMTKELKKAKEEAEKANDAKGEFLANMSHEIRTPMNAIIGMTRLLKQTRTDMRQRDFLNKIELSGNTLLKLIEDILDFSKIEAGKLVLEKIKFSPEKVLTDISALMEIKAKEKGLDFSMIISPNLPFSIYGDPFRLSQVLLNLTANAVKFTEKGEVEIAVQTISFFDNKSVLKFSVSDTGIGMTDSTVKNLFNPFTQADMSTTRKYGGTGLGLAISQELVKKMGSFGIIVESEKGKGSRFSFEVEFEYEDKKQLIEDKSILPLKVLVLDSNEKFLNSTRETLESFMFETFACSDENCFFQKIESFSDKNYFFDLLIVNPKDISNPKKLEFLKNQEEKSGRNLKIILFTDYKYEGIKSDFDFYFADNFVPKFSGRSFLLDTILKTFDKKPLDMFKEKESDLRASCLDLLKNKKVLVAEDNELNTEVAVLLLKSAGVDSDTALNGKQAFEKIVSNNYDAVLMDIQMPVLDGYKAAEKIRNEIKGPKKNIPIIAMTAHAMERDRKKALAHKFDYYVTKPVNPEILFETLCKAISGKKHVFVSSDNKSKLEFVSEKFDQKRIEEIFGNNENGFKDILKTFYISYSPFKEKFKNYLNNNEKKKALEILHSLKGASGNIGINILYSIITDLEKELLNKETDKLNNLLNDFYKELDETLIEINNYLLKDKGFDETKVLDKKDILKQIEDILPLIQKRSPEALEKIDKFVKILPKDLIKTGEIISNYSRNYKFSKTLAELNKLKNELEKDLES
jgi:PAS domain S-box-containing protein